MSDIDLSEVRRWALLGGEIARRSFRHTAARRKADRSWVTAADDAVERAVAEQIRARYPEHGIIGEEQTRHATDGEFLWAIDPIDGTGSFVAGLPTWGVSIGLLRRGVPYLGVLYLPLLEDCYWVGPDGPAYLNDQPIHVAAPRPWDSEDWLAVPSDTHRRFQIDFPGKTRALGCTIAAFGYVASGSAVGALFSQTYLWDIAAALPILQAAGGVAVDLRGRPLDLQAMSDGQTQSPPFLIAAPALAERLRAGIAPRTGNQTQRGGAQS